MKKIIDFIGDKLFLFHKKRAQSFIDKDEFLSLKRLIEGGFDANKAEILFYAILKDKYIKELIDLGLDVNYQNIDYQTPAMFAANLKTSAEDFSLLISKGINSNLSDIDGCGILHYAVWGDNAKEKTKILIDNGVELEKKDNYKKTPLHYACHLAEDEDSLDVLIEAGADINAVDIEGNTPLILAVLPDDLKMVEQDVVKKKVDILINAGADRKAKNKQGKDYLDIYRENYKGSLLI